MTEEAILVTGSSGRLGLAVVTELSATGYRVVGADRVVPEQSPEGVDTFHWDGREVAPLAAALETCTGLIHLAAIPQPYGQPDEVVFVNNTQATFAALQAAALAGITRVAIASSGSAYGTAWSPEPTTFRYVPVDEEHPFQNRDPYGLSKEVDERTAEMFCRRYQMSVAALRFHWLATPAEQLRRLNQLRTASVSGERNWPHELRELWGYVDLRDAARACRLAVEAARREAYGFVPMNIVAADALTDEPIQELLSEHAPRTEIRAPLAPHAGAFDISRARQVITWEPLYSWRDQQEPANPEQ
jgi:nucleoside-diphosphate-sugar epimerase